MRFLARALGVLGAMAVAIVGIATPAVSETATSATTSNQEWQYTTDHSTSLSITWPKEYQKDSRHVSIRVDGKGAAAGKSVTLTWSDGADAWPLTKEFEYTKHVNWPNWSSYEISKVEVKGKSHTWDNYLSTWDKSKHSTDKKNKGTFKAYTEVVCWVMPEGATDQYADQSTIFPQTLVDCDILEQQDPGEYCGRWIQQDWYLIESKEDQKLLKSLIKKGTLEWRNGGPEDSKIYKMHTFHQLPDCAPEPEPEPEPIAICVWNDDTQTAERVEVLPGNEGDAPLYVDGSECTPAPEPEPVYVDICVWDTVTQTASSERVLADDQGNAPEYVDGSECTPTTEVCYEGPGGWAGLEIPVTGVTEGDKPWTGNAADCLDPTPEPEPQEPTFNGTLVCLVDTVWLDYTLAVEDPDGVYNPGEPATVTFVNPDGDDFITTVPVGENLRLWPGAGVAPADGLTEADIDPTDPDTYTVTSWPGWEFSEEYGEWVPGGSFRWITDGVTVLVDLPGVAPSLEFEFGDARAQADCFPTPPETTDEVLPIGPPDRPTTPPRTVDDVLGSVPLAPPATAVISEVNYAG